MMMPQYRNELTTDQGGISEEIFKETYGVTLGAVARAEVYPVFSPFLSYGYFAEFSMGALINSTHMYLEHGHRLFVGFHPVMIGGEISYLPFRNAAFYSIKGHSRTSVTEKAALVRYENLWRYGGLVRVVINHEHFIDAGYYREYYPHPNGSTKSYNAIRVNYWKFNGIDVGFEFSWELYPNGTAFVSTAPTADELKDKAFYFNLTVSKSFDLFGKPFYKWFRK